MNNPKMQMFEHIKKHALSLTEIVAQYQTQYKLTNAEMLVVVSTMHTAALVELGAVMLEHTGKIEENLTTCIGYNQKVTRYIVQGMLPEPPDARRN